MDKEKLSQHFVERLSIAIEFEEALLLQISEFKQVQIQRLPILRSLIEKKQWPLTKSNDIDPDTSKIANLGKAGIVLADLLRELEPFVLLLLDFIDIRNNINKLLLEFSQNYNSFENDEIYYIFIQVFNKNTQIHLMLAAFKMLKPIVGGFLCVSKLKNNQVHQSAEIIQTFLKEFVDPILFLRRELGSISQIVEVAMSQTNENLNICRTFSNLAWFGPIGVYKEDGQLLQHLFPNPELVDDQGLLRLQHFMDSVLFCTFGYLICSDIIKLPQNLSDIRTLLSEYIVIPIGHDEVFQPHAAFDQLFHNIKPKGLKIEKNMPTKALDLAVQNCGYKATIRRALLLDTGTRLLHFLLEDTKRYIGACVENVITTLTLIDHELHFYFAHSQRQLVGRRTAQPKEQDFIDPIRVCGLIDIGIRLRDLASLHAEEITSFSRMNLQVVQSSALRFAIQETGRLLEPESIKMLNKCIETLETAGNLQKVGVKLANQRNLTQLQLTRLELLRIVSENTNIQMKSYPAFRSLWLTINRICHRITTSDYYIFAHIMNPLCGSGSLRITSLLYGNMNRYINLVSSYMDSNQIEPNVLCSLMRQPSALQYLSHPLINIQAEALAQENAFYWTKILIFIAIRKLEVRLVQIVILSIAQNRAGFSPSRLAEAQINKIDRKTKHRDINDIQNRIEAFGRNSTFAERGKIQNLELVEAEVASIFGALKSITGGEDVIDLGTIMNNFGSNRKLNNSFPSFFTYNMNPTSKASQYFQQQWCGNGNGVGNQVDDLTKIAKLINNDGDQNIVNYKNGNSSNIINLRSILSVMIRRLLFRAIAHICIQSDEEFSPSRSTLLILQKLNDITSIVPFFTSTALYIPSVIDDCARIVERGAGRVNSSQAVGFGETLIEILDYDGEKSNMWWEPVQRIISESIGPIKPGTTEEFMPKLTFGKESEWPVAPSVCLSIVQDILLSVRQSIIPYFPLLQFDEIAQRVLLNLCTAPQFIPSGLAQSHAIPIGSWLYRLFGYERGGWDVDGQGAIPAEGINGNALIEVDCSETTGYLAVLFGKWYSDVFISGLLGGLKDSSGQSLLSSGILMGGIGSGINNNAQVIFSGIENGFIRPPFASIGSQNRGQGIISRASACEIRALTELIGPFGIEVICAMVETIAIPRLMDKIRRFMDDQQRIFDDIRKTKMNIDTHIVYGRQSSGQTITQSGQSNVGDVGGGEWKDVGSTIDKNLRQLYQQIEEVSKGLKGRECSEFIMPLIALGSATHLVEILRLNCSQFTVQRLSKPIHCLKAIATTSHIKLDARCTFVESSRLYSLKSPLSDCLPTVISAPTPAISLGGAESWEPEFFTHVRYPLPGYESKSIAVNIPYALLTALISPNLWNDTTYIPAIPGFDRNIHEAARGLIFYTHVVTQSAGMINDQQ